MLIWIVLGIVVIIVFLSYIAYTSETDKEIAGLKKSVEYWRKSYQNEKEKTISLEKLVKKINVDSNSLQNKEQLIEKLKSVNVELNQKYNQLSKKLDNANEVKENLNNEFSSNASNNTKLVQYWQNVCKEKVEEISRLTNTVLLLKNSIETKSNYAEEYFRQEDISKWKSKYEDAMNKYIKANNDIIALKAIYDKEHSELILLKQQLLTSRQKIVELEKNSIKKYTKKDILAIKDWNNFEEFVADKFKKHKYKTILTSATNDGEKDIIVEKDGIKTYIECKYWQANHYIGREPIQKLAGAAMMDGVKNAIFITTSSYNDNAVEAAKALNNNGFNIQLWDTNKLLKFINS